MQLCCNLSSISSLLHVSKIYDNLVYVKLIHISRFRNDSGGAFPKPPLTKLMHAKCHASCHLTMSESHLMVSQMPDIIEREHLPKTSDFWGLVSLLVFRMPHCRILLYFELTLGSNCVTSNVLTNIEVWSAWWLCNKCSIALSPQLVKISRPKPHKLNINASPNFKRIWRGTCFLTQNQTLVIDYTLNVNPHLLSLCWIG
jgi:hypothetical protein